MKRLSYKEVETQIDKLGFKLISLERNQRSSLYVTIINKNKYMAIVSYTNLVNAKRKPSFFYYLNPYTIQNIKLWIKLKNKQFDLVSEEYIGSGNKMSWYCYKCNEIFISCWTDIKSGYGCGVCSGKQVRHKTSFGYHYPELIYEWSDKNKMSAFEVSPSSHKRVLWKCSDDECSHEWETHVNSRTNMNSGCPACAGNYAVTNKNRLSVIRPDLVEEWNFKKNKLTPDNIAWRSGKKVWWKCKKCNYEWDTTVSNRASGHGCPACAGNILTDINRLSILQPGLIMEWDYKKNELTPDCFPEKSNKKAWWVCKDCNHEWDSIISGRSNGVGCPSCASSKGEKIIAKLLSENNIEFIQQMTFNECKYKRKLKFDFYIIEYSLCIEYNGQQHYSPVDFSSRGLALAEKMFEIQQIKDQIKRDFCKKNNVELLEIPYWDFDNIEDILKECLYGK